MKQYKYQIIFLFIVLVTLIYMKNSPKNRPEVNLTEDFISYYKEHVSTMAIDTEISVEKLDKEDAKTNPRVALTLSTSSERMYQWLLLSPQERKSVLHIYANMVRQYTKDREWSDDYYLYVSLYCRSEPSMVYDAEENILWTLTPSEEQFYRKVYEKFGTFDPQQIADTWDGEQFIIDHGGGYYTEDGEFRISYLFYDIGPYIVITFGEFASGNWNYAR